MLYPAMLAVAWAGPSTTEPSGPMRIKSCTVASRNGTP